MRNPERILKMLNLLGLIWQLQPDTRFNQLIHNIQSEYNIYKNNSYRIELWEKEKHENIVAYRRRDIIDLFSVEDEDFLEFLELKFLTNDQKLS